MYTEFNIDYQKSFSHPPTLDSQSSIFGSYCLQVTLWILIFMKRWITSFTNDVMNTGSLRRPQGTASPA